MNDRQPTFLEFFPVSLFGAVMGCCGLSFAWRFAAKLWGLPTVIGEVIGIVAIVLFIILSVAYLVKLKRYPQLVKADFKHPVLISFFGTIIISLLLLPGIILPYHASTAIVIWSIGTVLILLFALKVLRKWLDHQQEPASAVPAWIIPVVGTLDVPIIGAQLPVEGIKEVCLFFFAIGILFAIILMTIIIARLLFQPALPEAAQPTLLILVGPFALAFSGYILITGGQDTMSSVFFYFDLFLLLLFGSKIALLPRCCPFRVSWWAVGFPLAAITIASLRFASNKDGIIFKGIAAVLLVLTSFVIVYLLVQSLSRLITGKFNQ
jgi:tellurite resistance protein